MGADAAAPTSFTIYFFIFHEGLLLLFDIRYAFTKQAFNPVAFEDA